LIYFLYYIKKEMELVRLINDVWQLIDSRGFVLRQGTWDECFDMLAELSREEENESYASFLGMSGI
jgi:hypothetical protein